MQAMCRQATATLSARATWARRQRTASQKQKTLAPGRAAAKNGIKKIKDIGSSAAGSKPELAVPIKLAARVMGVLQVRSSRLAPSDNILVHEVAHLIARFLTSNGKHLVRKARERAAAAPGENQIKHRATSEKN